MVVAGKHSLSEGAVWMRCRGNTMLQKARLQIQKSIQRLWSVNLLESGDSNNNVRSHVVMQLGQENNKINVAWNIK